MVGTSFGSEAALLVGAHSPHVSAVAALAPSDVVWAGVRADGSTTSHWTLGGTPLPYVDLVDGWQPDTVEHIAELLPVAGGDDQVWPSLSMAEAIKSRRDEHGMVTTVVSDPDAGHRTVLPFETPTAGGVHMRRGGTAVSDRRLGPAAWAHLKTLIQTS